MPDVGVTTKTQAEEEQRIEAKRLRELKAMQARDSRVKDLIYIACGGCLDFYQSVVLDESKIQEEKRREESGVSERFEGLTVENCAPISTAQVELYKRLKKYVELFKDGRMYRKDPNGIYLFGQVGTGKTHMISALVNSLIPMGYGALKTTPIELMRAIRYADAEYAPTNRILERAKTIDFLVIDDLGKDKPTEYSTKTLYEIINYRSENLLPIIITSNYAVKDLPKKITPEGADLTLGISIADRIFQGCSVMELGGMTLRTGREAVI